MTIRLTKTESSTHVTTDSARVVYRVTVEFKTEADANDIARAFEQVLAPRFTRDEAIAIVRAALGPGEDFVPGSSHVRGVRLALEALAAAGVFVDEPADPREPVCDTCGWPGASGKPPACADHAQTMADKLDAAGIR